MTLSELKEKVKESGIYLIINNGKVIAAFEYKEKCNDGNNNPYPFTILECDEILTWKDMLPQIEVDDYIISAQDLLNKYARRNLR